MASALRYYENAIFHSNAVKKLLGFVFKSQKNVMNVMDIGCGSGRVLLDDVVPMLPKNFSEVVGVDKYQSMIEHCRTLNTDPRIHFEELDITTKSLRKELLGRFDLITSFFALHYVRDYDQTIKNIHDMLKPNGELCYIQAYKWNPLYDAYRELCKLDRWKKYLQDFKDYAAPFIESDRKSILEDIFRRNGFKLLEYEFTGYNFRMVPKQFVVQIQALDTIGESIPEDQREAFRKDFFRIFCDVTRFDMSEKFLEVEQDLTFDMLTVHARKLY